MSMTMTALVSVCLPLFWVFVLSHPKRSVRCISFLQLLTEPINPAAHIIVPLLILATACCEVVAVNALYTWHYLFTCLLNIAPVWGTYSWWEVRYDIGFSSVQINCVLREGRNEMIMKRLGVVKSANKLSVLVGLLHAAQEVTGCLLSRLYSIIRCLCAHFCCRLCFLWISVVWWRQWPWNGVRMMPVCVVMV